MQPEEAGEVDTRCILAVPSDSAKNSPAPPLPLNLAKTAFLLDFDGTLVDIAPTPDAVTVEPGLPETLQRLRAATDDAGRDYFGQDD